VVEQDDAGLIIAEPDAGSGLTPDAGTRDAGAPPPPGAGNPGDVHAGGAVSALENCTLYPFSAQALYAEREGFGAGATGGNPALVYRGTSAANSGTGTLRAALESTQAY